MRIRAGNAPRTPPSTVGKHYESLAQRHLERQGLKTVAENYRTPYGEIDLVMLDKTGTLVFVEVRYRKSRAFGGALQSVTPAKCAKMARTAAHYLAQHAHAGAARFDLVAIEPGRAPLWVPDFFREDDF